MLGGVGGVGGVGSVGSVGNVGGVGNVGSVGSVGGVGGVGSVGGTGGVGGVGSVGGTGSAARYHAARASPGSNPYGVAFIRKACVCKACALYVFARVARPRYCARHTSHVRLRRAHDFASF